MIASGKTLYTPKEKQRVLELAQHPNYQSGKKSPANKKIAQQINIEFHNGDVMEAAFGERITTVTRRISELMEKAVDMKKAVVKVLMELENYELKEKESNQIKED